MICPERFPSIKRTICPTPLPSPTITASPAGHRYHARRSEETTCSGYASTMEATDGCYRLGGGDANVEKHASIYE